MFARQNCSLLSWSLGELFFGNLKIRLGTVSEHAKVLHAKNEIILILYVNIDLDFALYQRVTRNRVLLSLRNKQNSVASLFVTPRCLRNKPDTSLNWVLYVHNKDIIPKAWCFRAPPEELKCSISACKYQFIDSACSSYPPLMFLLPLTYHRDLLM